MKKHPCTVAFEAWKARNPTLFNGEPAGRYLANRIDEAFQAGWFECEQVVTDALGTSVRARRDEPTTRTQPTR
jgi:hypothetical protein